MSLIIVSHSGIVAQSLQKLAASHFEEIRCFAKIENIGDSHQSAVAILYDLTAAKSDLDELIAFSKRSSDALEKIVLITSENFDFQNLVYFFGKVGAILPYTASADQIILIARGLHKNLLIAPLEMLRIVRTENSNAQSPVQSDELELTARQRGVLAMLAEGHSNKLIARRLGINDTTVRVHVRAVLKKLGVHNRTQAALVASRYLTSE